MDKKTNVIVTGADGFLGKKICANLKNNYNIIAVDSQGSCDVKIDLLNKDSWDKLNEYTKTPWVFLIHLAFVNPSAEDMEDKNRMMIEGLCKFMEKNQNVFLIYPSTALVYGVDYQETVTENHLPKPDSLYAKVKLETEQILQNNFPLRTTIFRVTNIYGSPVKPSTVIGKITNQVKNNTKISLSNYGSVRDFIYVDDVVKAFTMMIEYIKNYNEKLSSPFSIFNLSTGKGISIYDLANKIASFYNKHELLNGKENIIEEGYYEYLVPSPRKLEKLINEELALHVPERSITPLKPVSFDQGLERMNSDE